MSGKIQITAWYRQNDDLDCYSVPCEGCTILAAAQLVAERHYHDRGNPDRKRTLYSISVLFKGKIHTYKGGEWKEEAKPHSTYAVDYPRSDDGHPH